MFESLRVMNLFGRAVALNRRGRREEALEALLRAAEVLKRPSIDPLAPWVLGQYISISQFLALLGAELGRPGIELDAVRHGLVVWDRQATLNPRLREAADLVAWEAWARARARSEHEG